MFPELPDDDGWFRLSRGDVEAGDTESHQNKSANLERLINIWAGSWARCDVVSVAHMSRQLFTYNTLVSDSKFSRVRETEWEPVVGRGGGEGDSSRF